jgi:thioredoxin 1
MAIGARSAMVLMAVGVAVAVLQGCGTKSSAAERSAPATPAVVASEARPIPRLIDLGAGKCIPCKAMAPILEQLRTDYTGRLEVRFIDVWQKPEEASAYGIQMIPTQIFYGADGRELARHEGFISREEILAKWKALGVEL